MERVGVKKLRDRLSYYLNLVRRGQRVLVLSRGEVVAEIVRPKKEDAELSGIERYLREGEKSGRIIRAKASSPGEAFRMLKLSEKCDFDWQSILDEVRRDGF